MAVPDVLKMIQDTEVRFVDLRFTDTRGKEHHVTLPAHAMDADKLEDGHAFDGSTIAGWKGTHAFDKDGIGPCRERGGVWGGGRSAGGVGTCGCLLRRR